ncbi:Or9e38 [Eciton burchellii]|nr:Or9e38 [Eciton burchellii]
MICIRKRYLKFNRIILLAVGIWPFQRSKIARLQLTLFLGILISFITFQLSRLLFVDYTFDFTLKMLSIAMFLTFLVIKYVCFSMNIETVRCLLEWFQYVYNGLQDMNEIAIYDKYGNIAKRFTINMILIQASCLFFLIGTQCCPYIFDMIMLKNETYGRHFILLLCKYYAIQEKHIHLIILHVNATYIVAAFILLAVGTVLISCIKLICGMFKIASYRLERAMSIGRLQNISSEDKAVIYKDIICAVDIHRKAMEFATFFSYSFEGSIFLLIIVIVCSLSLNLFRIFQMVSHDEIDEILILHVVIVTVMLLYMFIGNYAGQEITDHNDHVFIVAYNVQWYLAPMRVQKLILFLLQRNNRIFILKVGGLFAISLECFASLMSTSISYFTVMCSNHK